ncbi:MAG: cyclase family protein [Gammaproteobacteria bacterium]|nr:cyclase family protein [Gammaproteobacteria bacterium]
MSRLIDLSHRIEHGRATYPGLPAPQVGPYRSHDSSTSEYSRDVGFHIAAVNIVGNTGTYTDAPFHRYANMPDIAAIDLERLVNLDAVCIAAVGVTLIDRDHFVGHVLHGKAVLVYTDWSRHWGTPAYFSGHPHLSAAAARYLVEAGVVHVGIDSMNIDATSDPDRPVHSRLLAAGIPITEHLTRLDQLPGRGSRFFAAPAPVCGAGSFPVRAFAIVD